MAGVAESVVPVVYVGDIASAMRFYAVFGFAEQSSGGDGSSRWSYLRHGDLTVLLVEVQPRLITVELPLLIYLYVDDLAATVAALAAAGFPADRVGYPEHAPGGEARTLDPDGNVVLVGQRAAVRPEERVRPTAAEARFSLIRRAAEAAAQRGGAPERCQIGRAGGEPCPRPAEVRLADSCGQSAWACVDHADETLLNARSVFLATEDDECLAPFLRRRATPPTPPAPPAPPA
ncbi:MAG TPA: VOC family protein [Pilimelia sp.]|nr:VOC family protein [Pilimelia sp.]